MRDGSVPFVCSTSWMEYLVFADGLALGATSTTLPGTTWPAQSRDGAWASTRLSGEEMPLRYSEHSFNCFFSPALLGDGSLLIH